MCSSIFDDILLYNKDVDSNIEDLQCVLTKLREEKLYTNAFKRYFFVSKIIFLGYEVSKDGLSPELTKVQVVRVTHAHIFILDLFVPWIGLFLSAFHSKF